MRMLYALWNYGGSSLAYVWVACSVLSFGHRHRHELPEEYVGTLQSGISVQEALLLKAG
jgi:hypothetical protein